MKEEPLEINSLWYGYKTKTWTDDKSPQTAIIHNVMRVFRSVRNCGDLAYGSVPITTGPVYYKLLLDNPAGDKSSLLIDAVRQNYSKGWDFIESIKTRRFCPVIYPADVVPARQENWGQWEQAHYQALWLSIIAEKCTEVHMGEGWNFSNGCVEEFTHVMQLKLGLPRHPELLFYNTKEDEAEERERMRFISVYDHKGRDLFLQDGARLVAQAIKWLGKKGFQSAKLERCLTLLDWTDKMLKNGFYQ